MTKRQVKGLWAFIAAFLGLLLVEHVLIPPTRTVLAGIRSEIQEQDLARLADRTPTSDPSTAGTADESLTAAESETPRPRDGDPEDRKTPPEEPSVWRCFADCGNSIVSAFRVFLLGENRARDYHATVHSDQAVVTYEAFATQAVKNDPVLPNSGEFVYTHPILSLPGSGLPLNFELTYRSGYTYNGPVGRNWDHNWNARFRDSTSHDGDLTRYQGNRQDIYQEGEPNCFSSPAGFFELAEVTRTVPQQGNPYVQRTLQDGTYEKYEKVGGSGEYYFLVEVKHRDTDNLITISYDSLNNYRLDKITDTRGKEIKFTYTTNGRIEDIEDWSGGGASADRTWTLHYSSSRLDRIEEPTGGGSTEFTYTSSGNLELMTEIKAPREYADQSGNPYLKLFYDGSNRVTKEQWGETSEDYKFTYTTNAVTETDRELNLREYLMDGTTGAITEIKDKVNTSWFSTSYAWDGDALLTKATFPEGNGMLYHYSNGRLTASVQSTSSGLGETSISTMRSGSDHLVTEYEYETTSSWALLTKIKDPLNNSWTLDRDSLGNITDYKTPEHGANPWQLSYDASSRLTEVEDPEARKTAFAYDANGIMTKVTTGEGCHEVDTFFYRDQFSQVTQVKDPEGSETDYRRDLLGNVTQVETPEGHKTDYKYDLNQVLTEVLTDNDNSDMANDRHKVKFEVNILNAVEKRIEYYDSSHGSSRDWEYAYDKEYRLTLLTLPEGEKTKFFYEERGLLTTRRMAEGTADEKDEILAYDENGRLTSEKDGLSNETTRAYDGFDRLTKVTDPESHYREIAYDKNSNVITRRGLNSSDTKLEEFVSEFDDDNLRTKLSQMAKTSGGTDIGSGWIDRTYAYDKGGLLTEVTDPCGCGGATDRDYFYRCDRLLTKVEDAVGNQVVYAYNDNGWVTKVTRKELEGSPDPQYVTEYDYDDDGRVTKVHDKGDGGTQAALSTTLVVDAQGRLKTMTDPNDNKVLHVRDDFGRVTKVLREMTSVGSPTYVETRTVFDLNDRVEKRISERGATDAVTEYVYDNAGRLVTSKDEEAVNHEIYEYDDADNITDITARDGSETTLLYDDRNLLTKKTYSKATNVVGPDEVKFWYDGIGRVVTAYNEDSRVERKWNTLSRIEQDKVWVKPTTEAGGGTTPKEVDYTYDGDGLLSLIEYPDNTHTMIREYDDLARVTKVKHSEGTGFSDLATWAFQGPRRMSTLDWGNGVEETMTYDEYGRAETMTHERPYSGGTEELYEFIRGYDKGSRPIFERRDYWESTDPTNQLTGQRDFGDRYYYDRTNRLTKVIRGVGYQTGSHSAVETASDTTVDFVTRTRYTLDDGGNRKTLRYDTSDGTNTTDEARREDHVFDIENQLQTRKIWENSSLQNTYNHTWDKNGNLTDAGWLSDTIKVDMENRIYEFGDWTYAYDPFGRRIEKRDTGAGGDYWRWFWYDGIQCIQEFTVSIPGEEEPPTADPDAIWTRAFGTYLVDQILWGIYDVDCDPENGCEHFYFHLDFLGSVVILTDDPTGDPSVIEQYRYDEYGEPYVFDGDGGSRAGSDYEQDFLYTGRRWDPEMEAYYYRAREYAQHLGGFLSRDPLGGDKAHNLYVYVESMPAGLIDPYGAQPTTLADVSVFDAIANLPNNVAELSSNLRAIVQAHVEGFFGAIHPNDVGTVSAWTAFFMYHNMGFTVEANATLLFPSTKYNDCVRECLLFVYQAVCQRYGVAPGVARFLCAKHAHELCFEYCRKFVVNRFYWWDGIRARRGGTTEPPGPGGTTEPPGGQGPAHPGLPPAAATARGIHRATRGPARPGRRRDK